MPWYLLYASHPLDAITRTGYILEAYTATTGRKLQPFELRTPNEYVSKKEEQGKLPYSEARKYLFHYVFAHADINQLDDFLRFRDAGETGLRLVGRRIVDNHITASIVSPDEINLFFRSCEAYTIHSNNHFVPFFELDTETLVAGDQALVIEGELKGREVTIVTPPKGNSRKLWVKADFFGHVGVPVEISADALEIIKPVHIATPKNRYALLDDFFAFCAQDIVLNRIVAKDFTSRDIVRALQMKPYIIPRTQGAHQYRDSRRILYIKYAALLIVNYLLGEQDDFRNNRAQLLTLRDTYQSRPSDTNMNKILQVLLAV